MASKCHDLDAVGSLDKVPGLWVHGNLEGVAQRQEMLWHPLEGAAVKGRILA